MTSIVCPVAESPEILATSATSQRKPLSAAKAFCRLKGTLCAPHSILYSYCSGGMVRHFMNSNYLLSRPRHQIRLKRTNGEHRINSFLSPLPPSHKQAFVNFFDRPSSSQSSSESRPISFHNLSCHQGYITFVRVPNMYHQKSSAPSIRLVIARDRAASSLTHVRRLRFE